MNNKKYEIVDKLGEGTYGVVFKVYDKINNKYFAIKKIKLENEIDEGLPSTTLREISILKDLNHPNIVKLYDIDYDITAKKLELVFEFVEFDLKKFIKKQKKKLEINLIKNIMYQILLGINECHSQRIIHRDIKPQNILIDSNKKIIKIADFGLSRAFTIPIKTLTHEIETLWYRAPEVLLGQKEYSLGVDTWPLGCILVEFFELCPLFTGDSEIDQIFKIFQFFGTPTEKEWPGVTLLPDYKLNFPKFKSSNPKIILKNVNDPLAFDLILKFLSLNPETRISCKEALTHPFFNNL